MASLSNARTSPVQSEGLTQLAISLRAAQLFAHSAHNLVKGPNFFSDHSYLGDTYAAYEAAYDDVVERAIGTGDNIDLAEVTEGACEAVENKIGSSDPEDIFRTLLEFEDSICAGVDGAMRGASNGTQDLLQAICSAAEARKYKLQQRLG